MSIAANFPGLSEVYIAAIHELVSKVRIRIHNRGQASDESQMGSYKAGSYVRKRKAAGLQTEFIDLQTKFRDQGGQLRQSFIDGVAENGDFVMGFDSENAVGSYSLQQIFQERFQDKGGVWFLSDSEIDHFWKAFAKLEEQWRIRYFNS